MAAPTESQDASIKLEDSDVELSDAASMNLISSQIKNDPMSIRCDY